MTGSSGRETEKYAQSQVSCLTHREERKLNCLKSEYKGDANEASICEVPAHAPQKNSLWREVGGLSSARQYRRVVSEQKRRKRPKDHVLRHFLSLSSQDYVYFFSIQVRAS